MGTLNWLKASRFADTANPKDIKSALLTLKFQVFKGTPITTLDKDYVAGQQPVALALTQDENELLGKMDITPEQITASMKADGGKALRALSAKKAD